MATAGGTKEEYAARRRSYRALLRAQGIDGMVLTHLPDIRHLCGFTGSSGVALLLRQGGYFFTDFRYREQSAREVVGLRTVIYATSVEEAVAKTLQRRRGLRLGFDRDVASYAGVMALRRHLRGIAALLPLKGSLGLLRAPKSRSELETIRKCIDIAQRAFLTALRDVDGRSSEFDLAAAIDIAARRLGSERPSFDTIVAAGSRGALVHAGPSRKRLRGVTVIDWGVELRGYCSDTTRTVAFGKVPPLLEKAHCLVLEAQERALDMVRPGVKARKVDGAAREVIERAGYGDAFGHGLGHGVGLEVHERPHVSPASRDIIEEGMVFTNEPGIYLPGIGGVRVEDMVYVTATGPELLTTLPRGLDPSDYI
ncbi:MAG: Xaa-Pro peptidase family protein [Actinomycetota bacterium]